MAKVCNITRRETWVGIRFSHYKHKDSITNTLITMCYFDDFGLTLKIKELGNEKLTFWVTNNLATLNLAIFG